MLAISAWWIVGWGVGVVVIALVAALVLVIAGLARQVTRQADEITEALFAVKNTNIAIDRITRGLRRVRTGGAR